MTKSKNDRPIVYANKVPKSFRAHRPKMIQFLARLILRLFGWKIEGEIPEMKENENLVLIAAPHTSNWDGVFGFTAITAALGMIVTNNLIRAAFLFALCLLSIAGCYVIYNAFFLAVVQVMVYAGGVLILLIFGIMLITP